MMTNWTDLNKRQQFYLEAIFDEDQRTEASFRRLKVMGLDNTPARVWRWLPYNAHGEVLQKKFEASKMRDEGTGSTLRALEKRGLILLRYEPGSIREPIIYIQITRAGRALVRKAFNLEAPKRIPGQLQEWQWKALVHIYKQGEKGIREYPREVSEKTLNRLLEYKIDKEEKPLVGWVQTPCEPYQAWDFNAAQPVTMTTWTVCCLTEFGKKYYSENWQRYRELYPNVDAPKPAEEQQ